MIMTSAARAASISTLALALTPLSLALLAQAAAAESCAGLQASAVADTTITSTELVAAAEGLPEYCRVVGHVDADINFELRLPSDWNGRFFFQGYGGLDGAPPAVTHTLTLGNPGQPLALQQGFAVITTDTGHVAREGLGVYDGVWADGNIEAQTNWAHRSTHVVAAAGKTITETYYDQAPEYSYYVGCSGGGRHAAMSASRYPDDFDGIIAAAPFFSPTRQVIGWNWAQQVLAENPVSPSKLSLVTQAAVAACDANDGVEDGLVGDARRCGFDPASLQCTSGDADTCLTESEVGALTKLYEGARTSGGASLFPGLSRGAEAVLWPNAIVNPETGGPGTLLAGIPDQFLKHFIFDAEYDPYSFDFDADPEAMAKASELIDVQPDLDGFAEAGGKLLMWFGWQDPRLAPEEAIAFHQAVSERLGDRIDVASFFRLFMVPDIGHCQGGPGPDRFDAVSALTQWVEEGVAPEVIIASHQTDGVVTFTRPLCAWPQEAVYSGQGDVNDAANFECKTP